MRRLRRHHELIRAGCYLSGSYFGLLGLLSIVLAFLLIRGTNYPQPKLLFTFWQAILWQLFSYLVLGIGGLFYYIPLTEIIIVLLVLGSLTLAYFELDRGPIKIPVLHELADMILGKKHHR